MPVAILLAGGSGIRMGKAEPKQFLKLEGREIWAHTTRVFQEAEGITEIILACRGDYVELMSKGVERYGFSKVTHVVQGGKERYHSAFAGLEACACAEDEKILICDIVRPCLDPRVIERVLGTLDRFDACDTGIAVTETLFEVEQGRIVKIPDRSRFYLGQGPEGFRYRVVRPALAEYIVSERKGNTNISGIVSSRFPEMAVGFVEGSEDNIKITTPKDLDTVAMLIARRDRAGCDTNS